MGPRDPATIVDCIPLLALLCAALCFEGCSASSSAELTREQLLDPATCSGCHPDQYAEWAGSMHAYASHDPVFLAFNRRGQRETGGALGSFCVGCHAPMAVLEGATQDGLNLDAVPENLQGVTCFYCHTMGTVTDTHNNLQVLANDGVMRGAISDPYGGGLVHRSAYSTLLDRNRAESATTCGSCHNVFAGTSKLERTFEEWQQSAYSQSLGTTCGQCHMAQSTEDRPAAPGTGAPARRTHSHTFPAVDTALSPFADMPRQLAQVQSLLDTTLQTALCVEPLGADSVINVILDNVAAGHSFPSGANMDRRLWTEVVAYSGENVIYSSGVVPDGTPVLSVPDPDLWLLRECMFDASGAYTHIFWKEASYEVNELPALATFDPSDPRYYQTHRMRSFPNSGSLGQVPDRVTLRVRLRSFGLEILDDLIQSGDLDPQVRDAVPTFTLGTTLEWTQASATSIYIDRTINAPVYCVTTANLNVRADKFPSPSSPHCP